MNRDTYFFFMSSIYVDFYMYVIDSAELFQVITTFASDMVKSNDNFSHNFMHVT